MSLSLALWHANNDLAQACLHHPFVQGIGDGTLPVEKFAYYVGQDAFFLEAFARAYSIAAAKAETWQDFQVFHQLADGVLAELTLHGSYAQEWGVDLTTVTPGAATRRYTDFLLSTAWGQAPGATAVAMAPCMRLYAFLGQSLAKRSPPPHRYSPWIDTYSSDQFEPLAAQLEALIDHSTADNASNQTAYRYAMECELAFFEAAWQIGSLQPQE
ncbi:MULTISPECIES: TenA family protein [Cyanophyceae]|uniref:TenA family protein n=1 Tax=Leptolyngbya subtilissima DQ-A4 TaxID=2933933 RepID=A0ABV0K201_9CYAN|nr:TenA family protein [Nodosilinea sp. FACHB-141]MBD2111585.1 TenA family protein [Nodosilinea sp. FACHB-141]